MPIQPPGEKLTARQEVFCQEYLVDLVATRAYERAYNCSIESARNKIGRLWSQPKIQNRIAELFEERSVRTAITLDAVVERVNARAIICDKAKEFAPANQADALLLRHLGGFEEKAPKTPPIILQSLSDFADDDE